MPERAESNNRDGVRLMPVALAAAAIVLVVVLVAAAVHALATAWNLPLAGPNAPIQMQIEGPALESAPQDARARYFGEKDAWLNQYGWIDRAQGVARIPIDVAMELLARRHALDAPSETQ
jgi:hypothetical protein